MDKKQKNSLEKMCRVCEWAHGLQDEDTMLCEKKGVVQSDYFCRHFRYDPLKRIPGQTKSIAALEYIPLDEENQEN